MTCSISGRAIARQRTSVSARTRAVRSPSPKSERSPNTSPGPSLRVPSGASTDASPSSSTNSPAPGRPRSISAWPAGASNSIVFAASCSSCASSRSAKSGTARRRSRTLLAETGQAEPAQRSAGEAAELRLLEAPRRTDRLVHGGEHHVGKHVRVVRVDRLRVDLDLGDLAAARGSDVHHPSACTRLHRLIVDLLLRLLHLVLHLAHLLHELVDVHSHGQSSRSRASKVSFTSSRIFSSPAGSSSSTARAAWPSPSANARPRWRPVTS